MPCRPNSRAYTRSHYPIGNAFTPVPQFFVRVPRFFPAFVLSCRSPPGSPSPIVQVRLVRGSSPAPDVVEKRCGCRCSCCVASFPCAVASLSRRVCPSQAVSPQVGETGKKEERKEIIKEKEDGRTRCAPRCLFRSLTFANRASLFPPPPAVSSTLIRRPSSSDWCKRSATCSACRVENSRNAQPLDLDLDLAAAAAVTPTPAARVTLGVSRRTVGGGSGLVLVSGAAVRFISETLKQEGDKGKRQNTPHNAKCFWIASGVVVYLRFPFDE